MLELECLDKVGMELEKQKKRLLKAMELKLVLVRGVIKSKGLWGT